MQAEDLVKIYDGDIAAVKGISFEVGAGEAFGLLGPNGAGKTTTIGMLNTTVTPTSGRARLGGVDVAEDPMGTRAISSVVFQDAVVDQPLTGRQNLELHMRLWGVDPEEGRSRFAELTRTVGIADILDRAVSTYSGGQRRRMEIVRALLSAPAVLFLDEPTVGLDTRIRHDLFDIIATSAREDRGHHHHDDALPRRGRAPVRPAGCGRRRSARGVRQRRQPAGLGRRRGARAPHGRCRRLCRSAAPRRRGPRRLARHRGDPHRVAAGHLQRSRARPPGRRARCRSARSPPAPRRSTTSTSTSPAVA